jgi:transcriptional regulator with XRE-family HTH domain
VGVVIGTQLREAREAAGLSLRDVAAASDDRITAGGLSLIEQGQRYPTLRTLEALASVLRVTISVRPKGVDVTRGRKS